MENLRMSSPMLINTVTSNETLSKALTQIQQPERGIIAQGWPVFTDLIGGFREKEFTIFCGATGSGKTQWLANLAAKMVLENTKCFIGSIETGSVDFMIRVLSVLIGSDLNTGKQVNTNQSKAILKVMDTHQKKIEENLIFSTHENRVDVQEMVQTLHYACDMQGVKIAILDNLNFFLKPVGSNNAIVEMDEAIHSFVMLAKKIPIHILLVMHPRKTDGGKLRSEFDIKGSSTAVQEASNVLLMNRLDENDLKDTSLNPFMREFVFSKIRKRGFNVGRKIHMKYEGGRYVEL